MAISHIYSQMITAHRLIEAMLTKINHRSERLLITHQTHYSELTFSFHIYKEAFHAGPKYTVEGIAFIVDVRITEQETHDLIKEVLRGLSDD